MEHEENLHRSLGNIEGKLDTVIDNQTDFKRRHESLEGRVGQLENRVNRWGGAIGVLLGIYVFIGDRIRSIFFGS
jgi:hypothetical protein